MLGQRRQSASLHWNPIYHTRKWWISNGERGRAALHCLGKWVMVPRCGEVRAGFACPFRLDEFCIKRWSAPLWVAPAATTTATATPSSSSSGVVKKQLCLNKFDLRRSEIEPRTVLWMGKRLLFGGKDGNRCQNWQLRQIHTDETFWILMEPHCLRLASILRALIAVGWSGVMWVRFELNIHLVHGRNVTLGGRPKWIFMLKYFMSTPYTRLRLKIAYRN